jgi:hypothetical protein
MNKIKELWHRLVFEDTPKFQKWFRNLWLGISGSAGSIMAAVDKWPNAFDPMIAKICGYIMIGGIVGALTAQSAKKDTPIPDNGGGDVPAQS